MKINTSPRLSKPDAALEQQLRAMAYQINATSEGAIVGAYNAATAAPTTETWNKGDFIRNSAPAVSTANGTLVFGWVCTVAGTPGTWAECSYVTNVVQLQQTVFSAPYTRNDGLSTAHDTQVEVASWSAATVNTPLGTWTTSTGRLTPNKAGYYFAKVSYNFGSSTISLLQVSLAKNGTNVHVDLRNTVTDIYYAHAIASGLIYCNGITDYISCFIRQVNSTSSAKTLYDTSALIDVFLVRPD